MHSLYSNIEEKKTICSSKNILVLSCSYWVSSELFFEDFGKTKTEVILHWVTLVEIDGLGLAKYSIHKTKSESPEHNLALLACANSFIPVIWKMKDFIF